MWEEEEEMKYTIDKQDGHVAECPIGKCVHVARGETQIEAFISLGDHIADKHPKEAARIALVGLKKATSEFQAAEKNGG